MSPAHSQTFIMCLFHNFVTDLFTSLQLAFLGLDEGYFCLSETSTKIKYDKMISAALRRFSRFRPSSDAVPLMCRTKYIRS